MKLARPPIALEIGSAINTPSTPSPNIGSTIVSGTTIITFLNIEKNTALLAHPNAVNVDCPTNWNDIKKKPKKYSFNACSPKLIIVLSVVNTDRISLGNIITASHTISIYKNPITAVNLIAFLTLSYCFAP